MWTVREDTPDTHQAKQGTPSMGGIGIISIACLTYCAVLLTVGGLSWFSYANNTPVPWPRIVAGVLLPPLTVAVHALLGFADDWSKASGRGGLRARAKFAIQVLLGVSFIVCLIGLTATQSYLGVRFLFGGLLSGGVGGFALSLLFILLLIVATCNAVNLTDGIDGLAAGLAVQCGLAFLLCEFQMLEITYFSNLMWAALAGACLGFLNFNRYPARVFMGDTGSLALGAALGAGAVMAHAVFLLPFIGFIYYVEMASVLLQVAYFKWTKRQTGEGQRVFRRAPLHHHFELGGWTEWRVVMTFWAINLGTTLIGLLLWSLNILPRWPR